MDRIINFALFRNILSNSRVALKLALTKKKAASIEKCAAGELGWRLFWQQRSSIINLMAIIKRERTLIKR
jgi:hypothetical protein